MIFYPPIFAFFEFSHGLTSYWAVALSNFTLTVIIHSGARRIVIGTTYLPNIASGLPFLL